MFSLGLGSVEHNSHYSNPGFYCQGKAVQERLCENHQKRRDATCPITAEAIHTGGGGKYLN